jgi:arginine/lysine/ornithine decarboxylase
VLFRSISCESIASYPPGVPALLPGERISGETVAYLRELAASGARLHGASDPAFETINVLVDGHRDAAPEVPSAGRTTADPSETRGWMARGGNPS